MRCVALLVFLVGCVGKHGGDSSAADSAGDSANGTPPCDLLHPWVMGTVEDVVLGGSLARPDVAILTLLDADAWWAKGAVEADGDSCPTFTESDDGTTRTITGDCTTTYGYIFGGTAVFTSSGTEETAAYDHFHFDEREAQNPYGVDADGTFWSDVLSPGDFAFALDLTMTMFGDWPGIESGSEVTYETTLGYGSDVWDGHSDIVSQPASAATGDLCFSDAYHYVDSCDLEDDDVLNLWGSSPATLTWNGSTSCDGCADVTIDGADAGSYCP